jgi:hypothetical protein
LQNGKTPSVDGLSADEGKKKKKSKSGASKKKKKGKEKVKDKDKERKEKDVVSNSVKVTEVNGDVPVNATNNNTANSQEAGNKDHSSADSSASSSDDGSSDDDSEEEVEKDRKKKKSKSGSEEPAPKGIKMKINLTTSTAKTQSSSDDSSSSSDDSYDSSSDDDDDGAADAPLTIDPASLNSPLFPDLNADGTAVTRKPPLVTTIKKVPAPAVITNNPRTPDSKKGNPGTPDSKKGNPGTPDNKKDGQKDKEGSSSEDDEPLANINKNKQQPSPVKLQIKVDGINMENLNGVGDRNPEINDVTTANGHSHDVPPKEEPMETDEPDKAKAVSSEPSLVNNDVKNEQGLKECAVSDDSKRNDAVPNQDVEMKEVSDSADKPSEAGKLEECEAAKTDQVATKSDCDTDLATDLSQKRPSPCAASPSAKDNSSASPQNISEVNPEDDSKGPSGASSELSQQRPSSSQPSTKEDAPVEGVIKHTDQDSAPTKEALPAEADDDESSAAVMDLSDAKAASDQAGDTDTSLGDKPASGATSEGEGDAEKGKNIPAVPPLVSVKKSGGLG